MSDEGYQYAAEVQRASNSSYRKMKAEAETLQARITALEAQVAAADRLAGFAQAVVDRWDSQDWRSGHTLDFITAQRHALAAFRAAKGE